ncbi:acyl-coenzyme A thioesterase 13-like [Haemaphysalis longicornis]
MQRTQHFIANILKKLPYSKEFVDKVIPVSCPKEGAMQFELKLDKEHCGMDGTLHTGMAFALIDLYMWATVCTVYDSDTPFVSLVINGRFLGQARVGDTILLNGRVVHAGRTTTFIEMDILEKGTNRLLIQACQTGLIIPK